MADESERHDPPHGATVRPFARPSTGAPVTPAPGAGARPAPYVSPSGGPTGDRVHRDLSSGPERGSDAMDVPTTDPADSDEASAAAAPEQGVPPVAEGALGDDPDAGLDSPVTEDAAPVIVWATPMGTPPVYPATEALESSMPGELDDGAGWGDHTGAGGKADSERDDATSLEGASTGDAAATAHEPTQAADVQRAVQTTAGRAGSEADAKLLERLAARVRAGAPMAEGAAARQEAAALARLLAELLAVDDAGPSSRKAPPGPAGVEL